MALGRGMGAVKNARRSGGGGGDSGGMREIFISSGRSITCRIYGNFEDEEDPVVYKGHFVKRLKGRDAFQLCGDNNDSPCVLCYAREELADKGIGTQERGALLVYDLEKQHKLDQEVRVLKDGYVATPGKRLGEDAYYTTKYPPCVGPKRPCPYCKQGNEARARGWGWLGLSVSHFEPLIAKQKECREHCKCGHVDELGNGTLTSTLSCANCGETEAVTYNADTGVLRCRSCNHKAAPQEILECPNCDTPQRCDIPDFRWRISRVGADKTTNYLFDKLGAPRPLTEEELAEYEKNKPDWSKLLAAKPPAEQARLLGIPLPDELGGSGDDKDDETGGVAFDDVDDDEAFAPAKPQPVVRKPAPAKPALRPVAAKAVATPARTPTRVLPRVLGRR